MRIRLLLLSLFVVLLPSCGADEPDLTVLFVGNSYTSTNQLPAMVEEIAGANGVSIEWRMIAPGGARLSEHRADPAVESALRSGEIDVVVFQEQSQLPSMPVAATETIPSAVALDAVADAHGVRVIWFQTWGHRDGSPEIGHATYDAMAAAIIDTYAEIARQTGGEVAGAGRRWDRVLAMGLAVELYDADGSHPAPAGSYLAALAITETLLVDRAVVEAPPVDGVDADTAAWLLIS